jgi:ABC-type uncharacterized transport system fused permease/ATPase subunit
MKMNDSINEENLDLRMRNPEFMSVINEKTKGMRFGDITLFISGTGSGKSSLVREEENNNNNNNNNTP